MTYDTKSKIAVYGLPTLERGNLLFSIFFSTEFGGGC